MKRKTLKLAFVNQPNDSILPPMQNSLGIWTYETARRLDPSFAVIVYGKKGGKRFRKTIKYDQRVHFQLMPRSYNNLLARFTRHLPLSRNIRRPFFASTLFQLGYALQVAMDLRKQQCDIVHIYNYSQFVPIIKTLNPEIKIVLNMRCEWLTQLDRRMIQRRLNQVDMIIGCSDYITEKIRCCFPQYASRCQTVYNGVDVNYFTSSNNRNRDGMANSNSKQILFVGRVSPEKGVHILLDAFKKVTQHCPHAHLKIVGKKSQLSFDFLVALSDDPKISQLASFYDKVSLRSIYLPYLKEQLRALRIESKVTFSDHVPYRDVANYYHDADVVVNPSLSESFGRSLIEAMAFKVPVVAAKVGGMPEIVENNKTGLLVDPGDSSALAEAILYLLENEDARKSMGHAARKRVVDQFSWDHITENLLRNYKNLYNAAGK